MVVHGKRVLTVFLAALVLTGGFACAWAATGCDDDHCSAVPDGMDYCACCAVTADIPPECRLVPGISMIGRCWFSPSVNPVLPVSDIFRPPIA